jgi:shikimate dehydrogenase
MKRAAVIGHPVLHSKSPDIHHFWLDALKLDGDYQRIDVEPAHLPAFMQNLVAQGYAGLNVTKPHKLAVMPFCNTLTPLAASVGAVNTVIVEPDGSLTGHNSDVGGFAVPLQKMQDLKGQKAVVLGAGGAARAVIAGLAHMGVAQIHVINRNQDNIKRLDTIAPIIAHDWSAAATVLENAALLVNTTSLGMTGQPALNIDLALLGSDAIVNDIVYAPLETPLLAQAKARGLRTIDGLDMLIGQAAEAFGYFFGAEPDRSFDAALRSRLVL